MMMSLGLVATAQNATPAVPPAAPTVANSPVVLPGNGLAQHPFLYCGEWNHYEQQQTMWIVRDGKAVWSYAIPFNVMFNNKADISELGDCTQLSNGNIVFSTRLGAAEITPDKRIVWQMFTPIGTETHSIQPIGLDHVLVAQNGDPAKLLVINTTTNTIEKEVPIPVGDPAHPHGQLRRARMTAAGTFLVAHIDLSKVAEYDATGKQIWSFATPGPWAAVRLANGNTLITGDSHGYVKEVNPAGEVVWSIDRSNLPGYTIGCIQDVERLANGDTVFSNWVPNKLTDPKDWPTSVQLIEVTPAKKIVWALREWTNPPLGPASGFQMLDQPGVPEQTGQQR
jgi:outer membrane protein assembly factor BamB